MKTHLLIAESGNLKWLACRTSVNDDLDSVELAGVLDGGIPPALDCATCKAWFLAECGRRRTKPRKWT